MHYVSIKVIYGLKIFSVLIINARNPAVYSAAELIIKAVSVIGNVLYGYYIVLILPTSVTSSPCFASGISVTSTIN